MTTVPHNENLTRLGMLASALAGRDLRVEDTGPATRAWTDGNAIYLDGSASFQAQVAALCVQSALLAAGSLERDIVQRLNRRPALAKRYLAIEGPRALAALRDVLPPVMGPLLDRAMPYPATSASVSLEIALGRAVIHDPPDIFGEIQARKVLAAAASAGETAAEERQHVPREQQERELIELSDEAHQEEEDGDDFATSPVGGGGSVGRLLQRMLQAVRQLQGGGPPGADAPTHRIRSGPRAGVRAMRSTAIAETVEDAFGKGRGLSYPEWNMHSRSYRQDWCTVLEMDAPRRSQVSVQWPGEHGLRKPLLRLGMGLDRFHRQAQGDDIDIDAAIEAQLELLAGSAADEAIYVESQRHRRDLSVMILLDISGSVSQAGPAGTSIYEQQRGVAAALASALHAVGDRVALYAFRSQGRAAVHLVPVKRFEDNLDSAVMGRLSSLVPGAYSRLGAAIRHASSVLIERGGTPRRLLVVLSDGLAYDHGYEPAYGAADARQALGEARRDGVGCVCLSVGAATEAIALRRVFGSAAYAAIARPGQLRRIIGPLFRAALSAAEVQRRIAGPAARNR